MPQHLAGGDGAARAGAQVSPHLGARLRQAALAFGMATLALAFAGNRNGAATEEVDPDLECLALNVYFEARGEALVGQEAVAHVALNRSRDPRFPKDLCDVIYQHDGDFGPDCAFSWTCDGLSDRPTDNAAWRRSQEIARIVRDGESADPTEGALWFHADYVSPYWSPGESAGQRIGQHIFYRKLGDGFRLARVLGGQSSGGGDDHDSGSASLDERSVKLLTKAMVQIGSSNSGLKIAIQYHSWNPAKRAVRINGATFREGDSPAPGILVESIFKNSVVLSYDNGRTKRILKG